MMTNCCSTTPCCPMRKQYLENYALHAKIEELEKRLAQSEAELRLALSSLVRNGMIIHCEKYAKIEELEKLLAQYRKIVWRIKANENRY